VLDDASGELASALSAPAAARLAADQAAGATQTDSGVNELMERVAVGGGKALTGAGERAAPRAFPGGAGGHFCYLKSETAARRQAARG
jgi:hypothetical protein